MANRVVQQNPYENASVWDTFTKLCSQKRKICALSNREIEISNREFTIENEQDKVDYDIYTLVLHILEEPVFKFPGGKGDLQRFTKIFKLDAQSFKGLWKEQGDFLFKIHIKNGLPDGPSEGSPSFKASIRINLFAHAISKPQREILARYTDKIWAHQNFKGILTPKIPGCLDDDDGC